MLSFTWEYCHSQDEHNDHKYKAIYNSRNSTTTTATTEYIRTITTIYNIQCACVYA